MASPYLERLEQLRENKIQEQAESFGLPLNKPLSQVPGGMAGNPMPQRPEEPAPDMSSMFGRTVQSLQETDRRSTKMFEDLQKLATGLRQEVEAGFMPEVIAKQKIEQYVKDSQQWFSKNEPGLMDNPQMYNAIEGILAQKMGGGQGAPQGGQAPMPPQGGEQAPMPQQGGM
ncbi:MAG: hypothetical protein ACRDCE_15110 [Cetobacterium sp.]|uniref:hypothetical protein n=1 Tax=Cetobacterium sp. TaxID=2071632 RepID=UPI003EE6A36E